MKIVDVKMIDVEFFSEVDQLGKHDIVVSQVVRTRYLTHPIARNWGKRVSVSVVVESPLANRVTSWPSRTSSSVRYDTTLSVPPYSIGGTLS
jgi:hypothetical protein